MILPMGDTPRILLGSEVAAFIQGGVSVVVAARDAALVPDVVRGCGCRVSRDRRRVTVLIDAGRASELIDDIRRTGTVAVVFSQPSTHRTIQLKGVDAAVVPTTAADRRISDRHLDSWITDIVAVGFGEEFARAVRGRAEGGLVAIRFTPTAAFEQTPGPAAGPATGDP